MRTAVSIIAWGLLGIVGCSVENASVDAATIEAELAYMCSEYLGELLSIGRISPEQYARACECQERILTDLPNHELALLLLWERARSVEELVTLMDDGTPVPSLRATDAMGRVADECFAPSAVDAPI